MSRGGPGGRERSVDIDTPASALVIAAHPDDAEFSAGATLAKWARAGCAVHHLVLTDGSKGTWDPSTDPVALVARRRQEQRDASVALSGTSVRFGDRVDGELQSDLSTRALVCQAIRELAPDVVLGHDPWKRYRLHPDHRAAGQLCVDGVVAARDPFFHTEQLADGLVPHRPAALLLFEADEVNHVEVVTDADLSARVAALECHVSQMETTHFYRVDDHEDPLEGFRAGERRRLERDGALVGVPLGEAFHLLTEGL